MPRAPEDKRALKAAEQAAEDLAADVAAGVATDNDVERPGGLAEAGTFDGAVGISEADALAQLSAAAEEAAVASEGAATEASEAVDAECAFLVSYLIAQFGKKALEEEAVDVSDSVEPAPLVAAEEGGSDPYPVAPTNNGHGGDLVLLGARMQAATEVAAARASARGVEGDELNRASSLLESPSALDQARRIGDSSRPQVRLFWRAASRVPSDARRHGRGFGRATPQPKLPGEVVPIVWYALADVLHHRRAEGASCERLRA